MRKTLRVIGAFAVACAISLTLCVGYALAQVAVPDPAAIQAAVLSVIATPNSWLAWAAVISLVASAVCALTPTPDQSSPWYWPYKIALELLALNIGHAKTVLVPFAAIVGLAGMLSACAVFSALGTAGGILSAAKTAYDTADEINSDAQVTEAVVCDGAKGFGAVYSALQNGKAVPPTLESILEKVSDFCSGDPVIGSTPIATLENLYDDVKSLLQAQAAKSS